MTPSELTGDRYDIGHVPRLPNATRPGTPMPNAPPPWNRDTNPSHTVTGKTRHTAATGWAGNVDIATIALWLGHESIKTTYIYQHADNALKQRAIDRTAMIGTPPGRYQPPDALLAFLESL